MKRARCSSCAAQRFDLQLTLRGGRDRRLRDRSRRDRPAARQLRAGQERRRRPARRGRRPEVGQSAEPPSVPSRRCSACAAGSSCSPTCGRSSPHPALLGGGAAQARARSRASTSCSSASSPAACTSASRASAATARTVAHAVDTIVYSEVEVARVGAPRLSACALRGARRSRRSTRPTSSPPRGCGAKSRTRSPASFPTSRATTCSSTPCRCTCCAVRATSTSS